MSDVPTSKAALGVQAYRWLVAACMALLMLLSQQTLAGIADTAKAVNDLRAQMQTMQGTTESRFNAHAQRLDTMDRRNDTQDSKIDSLWQRLWALPAATRTGP